jgi:hypothetical protein
MPLSRKNTAQIVASPFKKLVNFIREVIMKSGDWEFFV